MVEALLFILEKVSWKQWKVEAVCIHLVLYWNLFMKSFFLTCLLLKLYSTNNFFLHSISVVRGGRDIYITFMTFSYYVFDYLFYTELHHFLVTPRVESFVLGNGWSYLPELFRQIRPYLPEPLSIHKEEVICML